MGLLKSMQYNFGKCLNIDLNNLQYHIKRLRLFMFALMNIDKLVNYKCK